MAQFSVIQVHKVSGTVKVKYYDGGEGIDIIEIHVDNTKLRLTSHEWEYLKKEVDHARSNANV